MSFTDDQLERYARHIILKEVGGAGQQKLLDTKVLVVGAGGLGSPLILYLAAAGVGTIGVVDDDVVSLSNLQRQILHDTDRLGTAKTDSTKERIGRLNPDIRVIPHMERLTAENAAALIGGYDLVADGCDNFVTRFLVNETCLKLKKPLVSAALSQFDGQLATFRGYEADLPCYRCFVPQDPGDVGNCAEAGILGAIAGVMGSLMAVEVIKEVLGLGQSLAGRLLIYDALDARTRTLKLPKDPHCPCCGSRSQER
ncbi:HesA/MoeB/ThiF family protein [Luteithermobacter gelatinilyticus]|uniref:HesA/MoeB/ThiF family protein n=1 Tax=Luteithermobacter gelatinilyticus TaxID=2582913 RepID=UPI001105817B|nr:molybdopterin-synthase adenylyltransferase MoeB [Luteithermobacter gelatinilyticus]